MTTWITLSIIAALLVWIGSLSVTRLQKRRTVNHSATAATQKTQKIHSELQQSQQRCTALQRQQKQQAEKLAILQKLCDDLIVAREQDSQEKKHLKKHLAGSQTLIAELEQRYQQEYSGRIKAENELRQTTERKQSSNNPQQRIQILESELADKRQQIEAITQECDQWKQASQESRVSITDLCAQICEMDELEKDLQQQLEECRILLLYERETTKAHQVQIEQNLANEKKHAEVLASSLQQAESSLEEMTSRAENLSARLNLTRTELVEATDKLIKDRANLEEDIERHIAEREDAFDQGFELVDRIQMEIADRLHQLLSQRDKALDAVNKMQKDIQILNSRAQNDQETIRHLRQERVTLMTGDQEHQVEFPRIHETSSSGDDGSQTEPLAQPASMDYGGTTKIDAVRGLVYTSEPKIIDDLKRISGIAAVLESKLNEYGVYTYQQIFSWDEKAIAEFSKLLVFKDRIVRDDWQRQARNFFQSKYGNRAA